MSYDAFVDEKDDVENGIFIALLIKQ